MIYEFEEKIRMETRDTNFSEAAPRDQIQPNVDFAWAVLQLLNLMDTEVGSILGGMMPN